MRFQSLVILILIGIIPMFIGLQGILSAYREEAYDERILELQNHGNIIANLYVTTGTLKEDETSEIDTEISQIADIYEGRIIIVNNNLKIIKDTFGIELGKTIISEEVIKGIGGKSSTKIDDVNQNIEVTLPISKLNSNDIIGVIIMNFSTQNIDEIANTLYQKSMILIVTIAILIIIIAVYFTRHLVKPLKGVMSSIDRLTEGYMDEQVCIKGFTEVEIISESFNKMISRMQKLESSRQEFVSNVSHELKTPITSIKVLADSLLSQDAVPEELYKEFLIDITDEIERENKIINDLLSLVKLDKTAGEMNIASININDLLEQILKRLRPIAAKRNIELVFESFRPVIAEVDEVKLSLAISNLVENAIKYNIEDGWVRVSLNADHKYFYVKVQDSGIGIPDDAKDSIFERFYRVDKARSRETGGTGLGLAITRNAILMHRGAIKVYSKENEGTTFTVRVPLGYIA
jgi:signal transduction histidine kinase